MVRFSNSLLGLVNVLTFILSIPILGAGIWLATRKGATECEKSLQQPLIVVGVFVMVISLIGLRGACCHGGGLHCLYLIVMFLLIVFMFFCTIFTYAVTNEAGEALAARGYKEYRFDEYLKHKMNDKEEWSKLKSCLVGSKICTKFAQEVGHEPAEKLQRNSFSSVQSGCCKPPKECKFTYVQPTVWNKTNSDSTNPDCPIWDNHPDTLCYNCESCKVGLLDQIKADWKKVAKTNFTILVLLIIVYIIACCASGNRDTIGSMNSRDAYRQNPYAQHPQYAQNPYQAHHIPYSHQNP